MKTKIWQIGLAASAVLLVGLIGPAFGQIYANPAGTEIGSEGDGQTVTIPPGGTVEVWFADGSLAVDGAGVDLVLSYTNYLQVTIYGYDSVGAFKAINVTGGYAVSSAWTWDLAYYPGLAGGVTGLWLYNSTGYTVTLDAVRADYYTVTNTAPVAAPDAAATEAGVPVTIDVLGNDHDDDGDPLSVVSVGAAATGSTAVNTDGTVTYTPNVGFTGLDEFVYTISDGKGGTSETTVFVTVDPRNVLIDIKPGSYPNSINLGANGVVPLAILSEADFDATTVDPATVKLAGAAVAVRGKGSRLMANSQDVNGDGLLDLVLQVETENLDPLMLQDGYGTIVGTTYDGTPITGSDEITIVPQ